MNMFFHLYTEPIQELDHYIIFFESCCRIYYMHSGRVFVHSIISFFSMFDKSIFNVLNTSLYLSLVILIYYYYKNIVENENNLVDILFFILINLVFWFKLPVFGETVLWLSGAINYLWPTLFLFLFIFVLYLDTNDIYKIKRKIYWFLIFLSSFFIGGAHEVIAVGSMGFLFFINCDYFIRNRKFHKGYVITFFINILGALFLLLAPGNITRSQLNSGGNLISRFVIVLNALLKSLLDNMFLSIIIVWGIIHIIIHLDKVKNDEVLKRNVFFYIIFFFCMLLVMPH